MPAENTHDATGDLKQEPPALHDVASKDATAPPPQEPQQTTQDPQQATKESYADYIKNLPPPFWAKTEKTHPQPRTASAAASNDKATAAATAAKIAAVNAPVTAEQRAEDERRKTRSWYGRLLDRKERLKEEISERKYREPDLRPVERGSRAQLNVFGSNLREKRR